MYLQGRATKQNYSEAFTLLKKAADAGMKEAQFELGVMYANGEGMKRDMALAATYIELAANQGSSAAQYALGKIYIYYENPEKACVWFEKSAAQGYPKARAALKKLKEI